MRKIANALTACAGWASANATGALTACAGWASANATGLIFSGSLLAIAAGFWMIWPPLGLIVPGTIVCAGMMLYRLFLALRG